MEKLKARTIRLDPGHRPLPAGGAADALPRLVGGDARSGL